MTLKDLVTVEKHRWIDTLRDLNELMKSYDREAEPMYMNRLNSLRAGRRPRPIEIRAVLELSGNLVDGYKD